MGKKKMAITVVTEDQDTSSSRYSNYPMEAHLRTWDYGIRVEMHLDKDDNPIFTISATGGSNAPGNRFEITTILPEDLMKR